MAIIGYARVSTDDQNLDLQIIALKNAGCEIIFTDHGISGNQENRPGLGKVLKHLKENDDLIVWRLDRLGRSLVSLVKLIDQLGKKNIRFHSLNENIDTNSSGGRLVFHMMAALAEFERSLISERTRAGMAAARARGKHVGRPPSLSREQREEAAIRIKSDGLSVNEAASLYHVRPRTLCRLLNQTPPPASVSNALRIGGRAPERRISAYPGATRGK